MDKYIFGSKDSIHIIDLVQTLSMTNAALNEIHKCVASGGKILFVSTKKQATDTIATLAKETSQYYVNHRWLGGMLTNWKTISNSIQKYKKLTEDLKKESIGFTKKEILKMGIQRDKLERSLGGISEMKKTPEMIFIIDTNVESLAVKESQKLRIPIVAIIDTNSDPTGIDFPIPGNDDARRSISLYCDLVKETILDAQKNIVHKQEELEKNNIKPKDADSEDKKVKTKLKADNIKDKKKIEVEVKEKKKESIFAKVKKLASKK
jgi:small subunit ribosomal protein S2